jgi:hypothetical protein
MNGSEIRLLEISIIIAVLSRNVKVRIQSLSHRFQFETRLKEIDAQ